MKWSTSSTRRGEPGRAAPPPLPRVPVVPAGARGTAPGSPTPRLCAAQRTRHRRDGARIPSVADRGHDRLGEIPRRTKETPEGEGDPLVRGRSVPESLLHLLNRGAPQEEGGEFRPQLPSHRGGRSSDPGPGPPLGLDPRDDGGERPGEGDHVKHGRGGVKDSRDRAGLRDRPRDGRRVDVRQGDEDSRFQFKPSEVPGTQECKGEYKDGGHAFRGVFSCLVPG